MKTTMKITVTEYNVKFMNCDNVEIIQLKKRKGEVGVKMGCV